MKRRAGIRKVAQILSRPSSPISVMVKGGRSRDDPPTALCVWGRWHDVTEIVDAWQGNDHCYLKLVVSGGQVYLIRFDLIDESWALVKYSRDATLE